MNAPDIHPVRHNWTRAEVAGLFDRPFMDLVFEAQSVHRRYHAANEVQLSQLLLNLVMNAFQAIGNNEGRITVSTEPAGDDVVFSVADNGPGMSRETMEKIFDPFFTTKEAGAGTG